jgi:serine/threonine-protein kinase
MVISKADAHGAYRDLVDLGRGGMGDVRLTFGSDQPGLPRLLVVKRLRSALASDPDFLQMFLAEARTAARLHHANIAHTYEVGFDGARYFIAREYLEGQSMSELVRRASSTFGLPLAMQLRILADALLGLHHAHEQQDLEGPIVHGDFSPSNIFVLYDGTVKLVDFGIAKTAYGGKTKADIFKGKIQYVAPEQYRSSPIDRRTDVYSAGVILWEAATGRRLWSGFGDLAVMQRVAAGDIPLPSSIEPGIPKRLEDICMRALSLCPDDRYPTAALLRAEIEALVVDLREPCGAPELGRFVSEIAAKSRARFHDIVEEQLRLAGAQVDPRSLAPTVASRASPRKGPSAGPEHGPPPIRQSHAALGFAAFGLLGMLTGLLIVRWAIWPAAPGESLTAKSLLPASSPAQTIAAKPSPLVPLVNRIRLRVETVPGFARVGVDKTLLPADAHDVAMVKDHARHRVWAEAPGYHARAEWVRFDNDEVSIKLTLLSYEEGRPVPTPRNSLQEAKRRSSSGRLGEGVSVSPDPAANAALAREFPSSADRAPARLHLDATDPWKD